MNTATISGVSDFHPYSIRCGHSLSKPDNLSDCAIYTDWQVREDKGVYIPDILSEEDRDVDLAVYSAAHDHAKYLRKAQLGLHHALNLIGQMREAIGDHCDARAMQAETSLSIIEKKLRKVCRLVDKHDRRHTNLFLAYFDLRARSQERAE